MDKDSVLYQLMDMRVNGVLDRILEKDSGDMSCPLPQTVRKPPFLVGCSVLITLKMPDIFLPK